MRQPASTRRFRGPVKFMSGEPVLLRRHVSYTGPLPSFWPPGDKQAHQTLGGTSVSPGQGERFHKLELRNVFMCASTGT